MSKGYLKHLLTRRCSQCFNMDTYALIDKKYVKTEVTEISKYETKTNSYGATSRKKVSSRTEKVDIYDFTYKCENCGHQFVVRSPDGTGSVVGKAVNGLMDQMF